MLLIPPRRMSLEQAIAYVEDDELVELQAIAVVANSRTMPAAARRVIPDTRATNSPWLSSAAVGAVSPIGPDGLLGWPTLQRGPRPGAGKRPAGSCACFGPLVRLRYTRRRKGGRAD